MAFTTQTFLFVFFPIFCILYIVINLLGNVLKLKPFFKRFRFLDLLLIGFSLIFYSWTCFDDVFRLCIYIIILHVLALYIQKSRNTSYHICLKTEGAKQSKNIYVAYIILFVSVIYLVGVLIHFKYGALISNINNFLFKTTVESKSILAPLGISFITFSAISYLSDVYLGKAAAGNLIDCFLYITFFPKVVSGPIVLWRDFSKQINDRKITLSFSYEAVNRIMIGFAKKLILADTFGACIAGIPENCLDIQSSWGVAVLYMLQIYYDFSGYSDIAIGISKLIGFEFYENFNFPYLSKSVSEFWRRWHISLGTWFKEYIYIPLGGSRKSRKRTVINLATIFVLTGVWHGAGWTYMLWGAINGFFVVVEHLIRDKKLYKNMPSIIKWIFTTVVTFFSWEFFRFTDFQKLLDWFKVMFGITRYNDISYTWQYYFDKRIIVFCIIGILGATIFGLPKVQKIYKDLRARKVGYIINQLVIFILFIISILFLINSVYSPFIYFQY